MVSSQNVWRRDLIYRIKGVYYYCYEAVKAIFDKAKGNGKPMTTSESMLAGALAGSAVVFATHPIWTVNVSLETISRK